MSIRPTDLGEDDFIEIASRIVARRIGDVESWVRAEDLPGLSSIELSLLRRMIFDALRMMGVLSPPEGLNFDENKVSTILSGGVLKDPSQSEIEKEVMNEFREFLEGL